jgi:hypothetical protein
MVDMKTVLQENYLVKIFIIQRVKGWVIYILLLRIILNWSIKKYFWVNDIYTDQILFQGQNYYFNQHLVLKFFNYLK